MSTRAKFTRPASHLPDRSLYRRTLGLAVLLLTILAPGPFAFSTRASLSILVAQNSTNATPAFQFAAINASLSTDDRGNTPHALVRVIEGTLSGSGGPVSKLNDGQGETNNDDPGDSVFFNNDPAASRPTARLLMDLGTNVLISQINTYSWHSGNRAPQIYSLYAATGNETNFDPDPTSSKDGGDPTRLGYKLLGNVDTTATFGVAGGQYAVSFQDNVKGNIGMYRYLLWLVKPPQYYYGYWNYTFYSEFDVIEAVTPPPPQVRHPAQPQILWGTSDNPSAALSDAIFTNAPVKMIAPWYSDANDFTNLCAYTNTTFISDRYAQGDCFAPIIWLAWEPDYATNGQFLTDMQTLARVFKGNGPYYGPSYFVLFTELETYASSTNTAYFTALENNYIQAVGLIHQANPNAYVGLGFGGYDWFGPHTTNYDLSFWKPAIEASDFTAVQAMASADYCSNNLPAFIAQVTNSLYQLGGYGKPVMLSYFDIWSTSTDTNVVTPFGAFVTNVLNGPMLADLVTHGLFAWDWENQDYITTPGPVFNQAAQAVSAYASVNPNIPILVDNSDAAAVSVIGNWQSATGPMGFYGSNYLVDASPGIDDNVVRFTPNLPANGNYSVYLRWTSPPGRASNVSVTVAFDGSTSEYSVDQTTNGGLWVWLGNFNFAAGTNDSVSIHTSGANGSVAADAALFQFDDGSAPLPAVPTLIGPGLNANTGFTLNFTGSPNAYYRVWDSTNLQSWEPLGYAIQQGAGVFQYSDPAATHQAQRFYRVTSP